MQMQVARRLLLRTSNSIDHGIDVAQQLLFVARARESQGMLASFRRIKAITFRFELLQGCDQAVDGLLGEPGPGCLGLTQWDNRLRCSPTSVRNDWSSTGICFDWDDAEILFSRKEQRS